MFNFAGKSAQSSTKGPIEIDFNAFWKSLDESCFTHPENLDKKRQEIIAKTIPFTQNHHRDQEILARLRSELVHENSFNYSEHYLKKAAKLSSEEPSGESHRKSVLLGYRLIGVSTDNRKSEHSQMQLADEESRLAKGLEKKKVINKANIKRIHERIADDDIKTPSDIRSETKDTQILYLRNEIMKLEYQQLAESIISIKGKTPATKSMLREFAAKNGHQGNLQNKVYAEYELTFDESIKVAPTIIDLSSVKLLDKYRRDILFTSLYDATIASALQFNQGANNSSTRNHGKRPAMAIAAPIKQITGLFDEDMLGREINLKEYGLCHHCKQIKPLSQLVKCNYRSVKPDIPSKNVSVATAYKGKKHGQRSLPHGKQKKGIKTSEYYCGRMFCQVCVTLNYDIPLEAAKSPDWICPYCLVRLFGEKKLYREYVTARDA